MESSVCVKESVLVTPSEPTPSSVLLLSALDCLPLFRFTTEYFLVYRPGPGLDKVATTASLKAALAKVLVPYYPLAGRIRPSPNSAGLEVLCQAQGVIFIEAVSDCYTVNDLEKVPETVWQWRNLLSYRVPDVVDGWPPLVLQLTWLSDGGAALGIGIQHCFSDGVGCAEFLNYVAELASGKSCEHKPKPVWDRHLFNVPSLKSHLEFNCGPKTPRQFMNQVTNSLKPTCVKFDKQRLNRLKDVARRTSDSSFTSFEVLAAHAWRSWARALEFPPNQKLKLVFSINVRNKVKPYLPDGYYGNAAVAGCVEATTRELGERGIGYASGLVKKAKDRVDNEYVKQNGEWVSALSVSHEMVGVLVLTQWSRMGLDMVELGMEKPVTMWPISIERLCRLLPVFGERDSVKVTVGVPNSAFDNYHRFLLE